MTPEDFNQLFETNNQIEADLRRHYSQGACTQPSSTTPFMAQAKDDNISAICQAIGLPEPQ